LRGWGDGHYGGIEGVEGDAGVAADGGRERFDCVVVHLDVQGAEAALLINEGAADDRGDLGLVEGVQGEDTGAGEQRADDLEGRVLGRGADERNGAVLDIREDGVLLRLVEAMDLVDEEDGLARIF
jgi:hypothetical protein